MMELIFDITRIGLCVLSFGAGQDSFAILQKLILDLKFRNEILKGRNLVVVFADTGDERDETYDTLWRAKQICQSYGIKFVHLASMQTIYRHIFDGRDCADILDGFHSESWSSLQGQYDRNHNLAMRRNKSCTDNLKIKPIYRWLDFFCSQMLGDPSRMHINKNHIQEYATWYGKIEMLIGFSKGEEGRIKKAKAPGREPWWWAVKKSFPLKAFRMTRLDCIEFMESTKFGSCGPSMCRMCPNISKQTLLLMWLTDRKAFMNWCMNEQRKFKKWNHRGSENTGALGGRVVLTEELFKTFDNLKGWSIDQLKEHEHTHGHCINNGY